jgi:hypothetical protein
MSEKRLARMENDISLIKAAILGPEGNHSEGILAISRKNEREIATLRTTLKTLWAAVIAIPLIATAVTFFVPEASAYQNNESHR